MQIIEGMKEPYHSGIIMKENVCKVFLQNLLDKTVRRLIRYLKL